MPSKRRVFNITSLLFIVNTTSKPSLIKIMIMIIIIIMHCICKLGTRIS